MSESEIVRIGNGKLSEFQLIYLVPKTPQDVGLMLQAELDLKSH